MTMQRENAPTLCVSCEHFTKGVDVSCKIGNWNLPTTDVSERIRKWLSAQNDETSWTYLGKCPEYVNDGINKEPR